MKKIIIIGIILLIILALCTGYYLITSHNKLKICPDAWYEDRMPCACIPEVKCDCSDRQYLVVDGERRELSEFNLLWIRLNCEVNKPAPVY